jgi:hypothetical protein
LEYDRATARSDMSIEVPSGVLSECYDHSSSSLFSLSFII